MSLDELLDFESQEIDGLYNQIAADIKNQSFISTKLLPTRIREVSESLTVNEKHVLLWDILLNSTPNYRKATASRLRKMVVIETRTPSPDKNSGLKKSMSSEGVDIEAFVSILQESNPWWYVLNVDHEQDELSRCCHDTFNHILNPSIDWTQAWSFILPIIGTTTANGKVRLKAIKNSP